MVCRLFLRGERTSRKQETTIVFGMVIYSIQHERMQKGATKKCEQQWLLTLLDQVLFMRSSTPVVYSLQLYCTMYSPCHTMPMRLPSHQS